MLAQGGGAIVNFSSIWGSRAVAGAHVYHAAKGAIGNMTRNVAITHAPDNIRANSVHPGYILTPMMVAATDENGGGVGEVVPLRRLADPDEVSSLVLFLASEDSSYISGTEHVIDGGLIAG